VLRDRPEDVGQTPDGEPVDTTAEAPVPLQPYGVLLRRRSFWLLLVGSAASIGSIATVNFLMKFVFEEQGFVDQAQRNQIWSTASSTALMAAIAGRLMVGHLADRWPRRPLMLAIYAIVAIAIPMLFLVRPSQPGFVYAFGVVFGFAMGADYMLIPLMAADLFGLRSLGRAMSGILPADTVTQFWFPNLIAQLRAAWGGYGSALWVSAVMAGLGAVAIALLPRERMKEEEAAEPIVGAPVPEHEG
jgi:MFS family permease